jgi:hypothetical protein
LNTPFGLAKIKEEGREIPYDKSSTDKPKIKTTWVERSVPKVLEEEIHQYISNLLEERGYSDD